MPPIKLSHVVSFSSEDAPAAKADHLLSPDGTKKWKAKTPGEKQLSAVLQLTKAQNITSIHIGNEGSAFVEVLVGRQETKDEDFKTLLVASSFMTPIESRNDQNLNRVRMFNADKLNAEIVGEKWDRVKVVCTQPFNKHLKYGLSFLLMTGGEHDEDKDKDKDKGEGSLQLGRFKLLADDGTKVDNDDYSAGSFFAKRKEAATAAKMPPTVAAEMKSEKTLASLALEQAGTTRKRKVSEEGGGGSSSGAPDKKPKFYQLKKESKEKVMTPKGGAKLPRRDVLPGESPPRRKREDKPDEKKKKKTTTTTDVAATAKPRDTRPFRKLLDGVVFTISGIQNPTRGQIRGMALEMGAKYKPDWDKSCTHLVCAFANTPKFNQVKGKGKIVNQDWIGKCHSDKKKYPWRRYCLDPKDSKKDESEDEVWDEGLLAPVPSSSGSSSSSAAAGRGRPAIDLEDMDTDEEIEAIKKQDKFLVDTDDEEEATNGEEIRRRKGEKEKEKPPSISIYDDDTDPDTEDEVKTIKTAKNGKVSKNGDADGDSDDAYGADTDVDEENQEQENGGGWPELPSFFSKIGFYLFGDFSESDRKILVRKIRAADGVLSAYMNPEVRFVVTGSSWNKSFDSALEQNRKVKFVKASFVHASWKEKKMLSWSDYGVNKR